MKTDTHAELRVLAREVAQSGGNEALQLFRRPDLDVEVKDDARPDHRRALSG